MHWIALAAFLVLGYRAWPAILAGAFLVNFTTAGTLSPLSASLSETRSKASLAATWSIASPLDAMPLNTRRTFSNSRSLQHR